MRADRRTDRQTDAWTNGRRPCRISFFLTASSADSDWVTDSHSRAVQTQKQLLDKPAQMDGGRARPAVSARFRCVRTDARADRRTHGRTDGHRAELAVLSRFQVQAELQVLLIVLIVIEVY